MTMIEKFFASFFQKEALASLLLSVGIDAVSQSGAKMENPVRQHFVDLIWRGVDPFVDYPLDSAPDLQGWGSAHRYLEEAVANSEENCVALELGVWKGLSTMTMAAQIKNLGTPGVVLAVDTWLGSWDHWLDAEDRWFGHLGFRHGYPNLYHKFATNVVSQGLQNYVLPLPLDSINAAHVIRRKNIRPNVIHIDAGHDYDAVMIDLRTWWPLLKPGGVLIGDDYHWGEVRRAFDEFFANYPHSCFEHEDRKCRITKQRDFS